MQFNTNSTTHFRKSKKNPWIPNFPNPADFRFNYYHLMKNAPKGIGKLNKKVAIIGAGCAAMSAARELMRCGCDVTIYEASNRIGGRLYTVSNPNNKDHTGIELGAMRMPFFAQGTESKDSKKAKNSLLGYYLFDEKPQNSANIDVFPNPGNAQGGTGIYVNQGFGPNTNNLFKKPKLISWPKGKDAKNKYIKDLTNKVDEFINFFTKHISKVYTEDNHNWEKLWQKIVMHYDPLTFDDLVMAPAKYNKDQKHLDLSDGNLGGMGMSLEEASVLYTIGTGDGSWGAFYSIGALWWIRCTMFGFGGKGLQTVIGFSNANDLPYYKKEVKDSNGVSLRPPTYEGMQGFVEYLYYVPISCHDSENRSLYDSSKLFVNTKVKEIQKLEDGKIKVVHNSGNEVYDDVMITSTQWATQMSINLKDFSFKQLPIQKITAEHTQHNISSCKFFFPLKELYWQKEGNKIPQILVTDSFIQDSYAFSWKKDKKDKGVILASYTWEDDSLKLLPFKEEKLADLILDKLKDITISTVGQDITKYIDKNEPVMIQWINEPSYIGCSKLYRQRNEDQNMLDLTYNQNYSHLSNLYFAGENYSVEGGWTEPALRSSIDAVIQMIHHNKGEFTVEDFTYEYTYPKWPVS